MSVTKSVSSNGSGSLPALKIGSRVRCIDDGVEGRISWANGVSVKVQWDDGEQVTWRRDSLADRPIEILEPTEGKATADTTAELRDVEPNLSTEAIVHEASPEITHEASVAEATQFLDPEQQEAVEQAEAATDTPASSAPQPVAPAAAKVKKLSALEASLRVLAEAGGAMNCQEMIAAMTAKGYWTSPGGKTPGATLYSAILREITTKGEASRFVKAERGKFALAKRA